jgi:putative ATP-binding cassette transporter
VLLQVAVFAVFAVIVVLSIGVTAAHLLVKRWLQLDWRAWLTEQLMGRWMENGRHYRLLFSAGEHDNPDGASPRTFASRPRPRSRSPTRSSTRC